MPSRLLIGNVSLIRCCFQLYQFVLCLTCVTQISKVLFMDLSSSAKIIISVFSLIIMIIEFFTVFITHFSTVLAFVSLILHIAGSIWLTFIYLENRSGTEFWICLLIGRYSLDHLRCTLYQKEQNILK